MQLRACYPYVKQFYEYEAGTFRGILGVTGNLYLELLKKLNMSVLVSSASGIGTMIPGKKDVYSGCLGQMQANESDVAMIGVSLPILAPGLTQGPILRADVLTINSAYNMISGAHSSNIMDAFTSFLPQTWALIIAFYVLFWLLITFIMWSQVCMLRVRRTIRRMERVSIYGSVVYCSLMPTPDWSRMIGGSLKIVFSVALHHYSSCSTVRCKGRAFKVALVSAFMFGFFITFYFGAMIKTEMVIEKKPTTIESYQDILSNPNIRPLFTSVTNDYWTYKNAPQDSIEGRIWRKAMDMGIEKCMVTVSMDAIQNWLDCTTSQTCALLLINSIARIMFSNFCSLTRARGIFLNFNTLTRVDPSARETLQGLMLSSLLPERYRKAITTNFGRAFEHGLLIESNDMALFTLSPDTGSKSISDCFANRVITNNEKKVIKADMNHYEHMFKVLGMHAIAALVFLVMESVTACACRLRSRRRIRSQ